MVKKFCVIALCPSFTSEEGHVEMGRIVSTHAEGHTARDRAEKCNKFNRASVAKPEFGVVEAEAGKGQVCPELADRFLAEKFEADALHTMKSVLQPGWQGGPDVTDERIGWELEALGIGVDALRERFEDRARDELDAMHVNRIELAERKARVRAVGERLAGERSEFTYTFPAVAGMQSGRAYYAAQVPYGALVRLFRFDEEDVVPAHLRAQRMLNERRAEAIGEYVIDNPADYVLPAITASVSAEMSFEPVAVAGAAGRIGLLHIPMDATLLINDGQHRRKGIEHALARNPNLREETITVTIFFDQGLARSQQMFADINGKQVKPSSAINALYDRRNPFNAWVLSVMDLLPEIGPRVDVENATVAARSYKLWSLIAFKKFLSLLTGVTEKNVGELDEPQLRGIDGFLVRFFEECARHIPQWRAMVAGDLAAFEVREEFVIGHAVWLEALAIFARRALITGSWMDRGSPEESVIRPELAAWDKLEALTKVDPRKVSRMWAGRCVVLGKMQKTSDGVKGTAARLMLLANVSLPADLRALETRLAA
ncbi:DNA sulfur modification protein DndB [Cupriavidus sp. CP313]